MSGIRISRDLQSSTSLESVSSSSTTEQLEQNTGAPREVRTQEKYDPRASGATKEAGVSKVAEQKLAGQAQEARLRALLAGGLPKLPLIGTETKGFGSAPTGTMPMDYMTKALHEITPDGVNLSKMASMNIRELRDLEKQILKLISESNEKIWNLNQCIIALSLLDDDGVTEADQEKINNLLAAIETEKDKISVLERQHHVVLQEIESRNSNERQ